MKIDKYKFEKILDRDGGLIGYEVLSNNFGPQVLTEDYLLEQLTYIRNYHRSIGGKALFVNIERCHLPCHRVLMSLFITKLKLEMYGVLLVLEITERQYPASASAVLPSLIYLKSLNICMAADDFYLPDKVAAPLEVSAVENEVSEGVYTFIKIENSFKCFNEFSLMVESLASSGCQLIVERIETVKELKLCRLLPFYAFQGYIFNSDEGGGCVTN